MGSMDSVASVSGVFYPDLGWIVLVFFVPGSGPEKREVSDPALGGVDAS
jgi:hypothetical protein